jgi:hypothetical protein
MAEQYTPTLEERDRMRRAIGAVLFDAMNFPETVQARILGQNMGPLNEKLTNAALEAGFRLPDPAHDAQVAAEAWDEGFMDRARRDVAMRLGRDVPRPPRGLNPYRIAGGTSA